MHPEQQEGESPLFNAIFDRFVWKWLAPPILMGLLVALRFRISSWHHTEWDYGALGLALALGLSSFWPMRRKSALAVMLVYTFIQFVILIFAALCVLAVFFGEGP